MEQTWYEFVTELGREDCLREGVSSLRRTFAECGVSFKRYEKDLKKISNVGKLLDLAVRFARAKDPRAYLRRRFGH